jgi:natural product biosynthesis luciferase-like monooxygenase protein
MKNGMFESSYPLAPMQRGMLFHHLSGRRGVDLEQIVGTLHEPLDAAAFEGAWLRAAQRHDALRTALRWSDVETPQQRVAASVAPRWETQDWRDATSEAQQQGLETFLREDRERGFDLSEAPLFRVAVFRLANSEYRFVWTVSHAVLDGRSFVVVLRDVFAYYEARRAGCEIELKPAPRYRDYVEWLGTQDLARAGEFWREGLRGFGAPTPLPVSKTGRQGRGHQPLRLSAATTAKLQSLAAGHGFTLNTMVQGAWGLLLSRYSGEDEVVFGATRACRRSAPIDAANAVGVFINTLPVRVNTAGNPALLPWLRQLRESQLQVRDFEHTPLASVLEWSEVEAGKPLFDSIVVFDGETLTTTMRRMGPAWKDREFELIEQTNFPLTLYGYGEREMSFQLAYDREAFDDAAMARLMGHFGTLLEQMAERPEQNLAALSMLPPAERERLLYGWNETAAEYPRDLCVHQAFEAQAARTPDAVAVVFREQRLSYRALNERANRLARRLRGMGVGPDALVGIHVHRSIEMMVGLLGVLKAGGAYVPLDPDYPTERLAWMVEDSGIQVLLTETSLAGSLPAHRAEVICLDAPGADGAGGLPAGTAPPDDANGASEDANVASEDANVASGVRPEHLAYVIYTSGSTGKPKGVMVEHRNVVNFFAGMDERIGPEPGVWLAVTSLSFDISVLELFWTLARGFEVVLYSGEDSKPHAALPARAPHAGRPIEFSLFYFAADEAEDVNNKYRLLMEGARYADENGFAAVWTPERHFHAFGGLYPNPAVTSAAIAAVTRRVKIRAGSVVLPLHHPVRVAEEWSVVDNLSNGRVGISFASGWQPRDFLLRPENFADAKGVMLRDIEAVRKLWRGEAVLFADAQGKQTPVKILPRPIQPELPFWLTAAGNPQTFEAAGAAGAGVLTHLLGQTIEDLRDKLRIYRAAWKQAGHSGEGHVTLMLHSFVGAEPAAIRELVRGPMTEYLRTSVSLLKGYASAWPLFRAQRVNGHEIDLNALPKQEMDALLEHSFERYYESSGLFGTPQSCLAMVDKAKGAGVDEIACLIDFGVESGLVLDHLTHLNELRQLSNAAHANPPAEPVDHSIPALVQRHSVTHLQCTPSMAILLTQSDESRAALAGLKKLLVGGEALPVKLAADLRSLVAGGTVINMYGPTETTIWSTTQVLDEIDGTAPIGRPIANTQVYILDKNMLPVPAGVQGDLFLGGDGVVRGYLQRPELTAERFVANPFVNFDGARMYRTGDVARYRPDGVVEFLGRADFQVKIRGHRIELGEIETALGENPAVREAVVTAANDAGGHQVLVAYIRLKDGQSAAVNHAANPAANPAVNQGTELAVDELRQALAKKLPEYMTPSAFVFLDEFPLTPNGKVDRKRLPHPEAQRPRLKQEYTAPRSPTEEGLAEIWQQALGVERVGVHDNFFELGGHSLSTVQITFRIRREFNVEFPLQTLLRIPTIAGLAREIEARLVEQADNEQLALAVSEIENMTDDEVAALLRSGASA